MKLAASFLIGIAILSISSITALVFPNSIQATTNCDATSSKSVVSPDEEFQITITFPDNKKQHEFAYYFTGINPPDAYHKSSMATDNPYTFSIKAPPAPNYFSDVAIYSPNKFAAGTGFTCFAPVRSSLSPPSNICSFDFDPKEVESGATVTFTVNNTTKDYQYRPVIGDTDGKFRKSDGSPLTLTFNAPKIDVPEKTLTVAVDERGGGTTKRCVAEKTVELKVKGTSGAPGQNPCVGDVCNTALGNISTNPTAFVGRILRIGIGLAGGLALILMVIGSVRVLTSSGDQQRLSAGRDMIVAAVAGLLFLIFSVLILKFIGVQILNIPFA